MADSSSHLDKMARELRCPICLSLLDSAVSLTCNHVFCDVCIHKSMKSGSNCPVCKVPYHRREIRPAPHMDSLVNIYKSMKVASRIPLSVAHDESATELDATKQTNGDVNHGNEKTDVEFPQTVNDHQRIETSRMSKSKAKSSGRNRRKSSFSMNKRVQMPESPSTETPLRQAKEDLKKTQTSKNAMNNSAVPSSKNAMTSKRRSQESPGLAPFFWLRDDEDKPTQQTDEDKLTCTPLNVPCFSDIKDSDDDVPTKISLEAPIRKCVNKELFDSEMFEWTQRPCSPELCPSPLKMQVEARDGDGMRKYELVGTSSDALGNEITAEQLDDVCPRDLDNDRNKIEHGSNPQSQDRRQNLSKMPRKRGTKGSKRSQNKRRKINVDLDKDTHDFSNIAHLAFEEGKKCKNNSALGSLKSVGTSKSGSIPSVDISMSDKADMLAVSKFTASSERCTMECNTLKITNKNSKRIKKSHESNLVLTSKKQKLAKTNDVDGVIDSRDRRRGHSTPQSNSSHEKSVGKASRGRQKSSQQAKTNIEERVDAETNIQEKTADRSKGYPGTVSLAQKTIREASDNDNLGTPCDIEKATLRKCNATSTKCAFCLKSEVTEASGEILHYVQGKPVLATHGGDSVIHSHKNCVEWAPNVYFEDDTVVNLEEELARSRRIKCSLCGVKGAALGCYEKSCRKSFHVPCARKLRECRWDSDHFVILCPLHASSKLPCEMSTSQASRVKKGRSNLNGKFLVQQPKFSPKSDNNRWSCGRPSEKIVLCGSALTTDEKEDVSKFAKLSGVALSEKWNPSVTHVIASTVENGACKRTLKVLKGILEGKWILSIKWVRDCTKALKLVEETPYEINCDIYGIKNGPYLGRSRLLNKQPKLFSGFKFYLTGDFETSFMRYLQDLATTAGGTILHRKPIAEDSGISAFCSPATPTLIIYAEQPDKCNPSRKDLTSERRRSDAEALMSSSGARVAHEKWVLDCIAGHKVLDL
ncbi:hypothetical protein RND81_07G166000 [Saponaria officinalis]|uniref:Uncharacterized protein n=1 Tax=Saponaria officinalis TaxID=3572 RepID=A0AAW1JR27_SAPOF